jgi:proteasome assembly chaperone (PAC2) family protein
MLVAFEGWNDAGDAASIALGCLATSFGAEVFATIDAEDFYDFTETRPQAVMDEDGTRSIEWPDIQLLAARVPDSPHDIILVRGIEPQLKWRTLGRAVAGVADDLGVELAVTFGALLADVPHTRPVRVSGSSEDSELATQLGLSPSRYEGPTGIIGVLHDGFRQAGIPGASLWAAVPHYVHQLPSPKAAMAIVERAGAILGTTVDTLELAQAAQEYERQVSERVADDPEAAAYVASLEEAGEDEWPEQLITQAGDIDQLAAEVERFLRDHPRGG